MTEILGTGCSTLELARSEGIQLVDLTGVFGSAVPVNFLIPSLLC